MGRVSEEDVKVLSRVLSSLPGAWVRVRIKLELTELPLPRKRVILG